MADFHFSFRRGSYGYEYDWDGYKVIIKAIGASKVAINECNLLAVEHAQANHPDYPPAGPPHGRFANRSDQMIDAIKVLQDAEVSWDGDRPWVHGEWGVEDRPVVQDEDIWSGRWAGMKPRFKRPAVGEVNASTMDRAMWLEFGRSGSRTGGPMEPRPFLYPAWDENKIKLGPLVAAAMHGMRGGRGRVGPFTFRP